MKALIKLNGLNAAKLASLYHVNRIPVGFFLSHLQHHLPSSKEFLLSYMLDLRIISMSSFMGFI